MKFKVGDKVIYYEKEYTITGICICRYCETRPGGIGYRLNGESTIYPSVLFKAGPKIGEQMEFSFMKN